MKNERRNKRLYKTISCIIVFFICVFAFVSLAISKASNNKVKAGILPPTAYLTNYGDYFYYTEQNDTTIYWYIYISSNWTTITQNKVYLYATFLEKTNDSNAEYYSTWAKQTYASTHELTYNASLNLEDTSTGNIYRCYTFNNSKVSTTRYYLLFYLELNEFKIGYDSTSGFQELNIRNYRCCVIPNEITQDAFDEGLDRGRVIGEAQANNYWNNYIQQYYESKTGEGYKKIFQLGKQAGINENIGTQNWFITSFQAVDAFLSIHIFPNITFGVLLGIPFVISVAWFIIRMFRGGGGD